MYDVSNEVEELKHPRKHPTPEKVEAIKDALEGILDRETYIHFLEGRFPLKQEEKIECSILRIWKGQCK